MESKTTKVGWGSVITSVAFGVSFLAEGLFGGPGLDVVRNGRVATLFIGSIIAAQGLLMCLARLGGEITHFRRPAAILTRDNLRVLLSLGLGVLLFVGVALERRREEDVRLTEYDRIRLGLNRIEAGFSGGALIPGYPPLELEQRCITRKGELTLAVGYQKRGSLLSPNAFVIVGYDKNDRIVYSCLGNGR